MAGDRAPTHPMAALNPTPGLGTSSQPPRTGLKDREIALVNWFVVR